MNVTAQFTLTVNQSKWLIAKAVRNSAVFMNALNNGRIVFKGSTTVSCVLELTSMQKLRICGRITPTGAKTSKTIPPSAHIMLYEKGSLTNIDESVTDVLKSFSKNDLVLVGANAIDCYGNAAILAGSAGGGTFGGSISSFCTENFKSLILTTSDKLIPGRLTDLYSKVSRKDCQWALGMSCGLMPIFGDIITETEAIRLAADVEAIIFARGGIQGSEGASCIQISGEQSEVEKVLYLYDEIKDMDTISGDDESLAECTFPSPWCKNHLNCKYAGKNTILK